MKRVLYLLLTILIISCGDLSLETDSVVVETISDGEILYIGDTFQVLVHQNDQAITVDPTSVDLVFTQLESSRSNIAEPIEISIDLEENPEPTFSISDEFEDGKYSIQITVYESDSILTEHSAEFIVFTGSISGQIKNIFPLKDLYTDSVVILESTITTNPEFDPYLIWKEGDDVISEGYLSEGLDVIRWNSGDTFGFVNVRLDLYPYRFENVDTPSAFYVEFPFVVNPLSTQLVDQEILEHYRTYFQFNGNYIDEIDKSLDITMIGEFTPEIADDTYGMLFNSLNSMTSETGLIPYDGEWKHFSLISSFVALNINNGYLFSSNLGDIELNLSLLEGSLIHSFGIVGPELTSDHITELVIGQSYSVKINYIYNGDLYNYFIYLDDVLITSGESYVRFIDSEEETDLFEEFVIGSTNTDFIIDTLQIYIQDDKGRNNIIPDNGSDLDFSENFHSAYLPDGFTGTGSVTGEKLIMNPEDSLQIELPIGRVDFDMQIFTETTGLELMFNGSDMGFEILSSSLIKRRGNSLFVNDDKIDDFDLDIKTLTLKANTLSLVDLITVDFMDIGIEEK